MGLWRPYLTKLSAVFCKIDLPHMSVGERGKKSGPKIHFWVAGEAFFSDLGHFSEFEDFSKFEDFGCLKHITLANQFLSSHSGNEGKTDTLFITKTCIWY